MKTLILLLSLVFTATTMAIDIRGTVGNIGFELVNADLIDNDYEAALVLGGSLTRIK